MAFIECFDCLQSISNCNRTEMQIDLKLLTINQRPEFSISLDSAKNTWAPAFPVSVFFFQFPTFFGLFFWIYILIGTSVYLPSVTFASNQSDMITRWQWARFIWTRTFKFTLLERLWQFDNKTEINLPHSHVHSLFRSFRWIQNEVPKVSSLNAVKFVQNHETLSVAQLCNFLLFF